MNDIQRSGPGADPDLEQLTDWFLSVAPAIHLHERHLPAVLHRLLLTGQPVEPERLAAEADTALMVVESFLKRWAMLNEEGQVFAFLGLTQQPTKHQLTVGDHNLFAWCAWDTLFLPELLEAEVMIESFCPQTGRPIQLSVSAGGIGSVTPPETVVSFVTPGGLACSADEECAGNPVIGERAVLEFCCYVHFLASPSAGKEWISRHPGTFLLPIEAAFELGRITNRKLFGAGA